MKVISQNLCIQLYKRTSVFSSQYEASPLSHTREWRRAKQSGGMESGEESRLAASPLDFALAAIPRALRLQRESQAT